MNGDADNQVEDILYVEDHTINVLLMQALFERRPLLRLHIAYSGDEALRLTEALRPSLLLLDIRLPDCHGTDLLRQLKQHEAYSRIPAVAVTAEPDFDPTGTGFLEVWTKPLDLRQTLVRLDEVLNPARRVVPSIRQRDRSETSASNGVPRLRETSRRDVARSMSETNPD